MFEVPVPLPSKGCTSVYVREPLHAGLLGECDDIRHPGPEEDWQRVASLCVHCPPKRPNNKDEDADQEPGQGTWTGTRGGEG